MGLVTFVIPVKDEQETVATLCAEIVEVAGREGLDYELIFVDDGSTDGSWAEIERLARADRRIRAVRLRRNFGKAAALSTGFAAAKGELIFTLDADLQDDPHEIPRFLRLIEGGNDFVSGWKRNRHDPWHKVYPSRVFNRMIGWLTGLHLHDNVCGFKCFRAEVAREVELYGEMHRFFAVRAFARGFKVAETEVNHRPRTHGRSKYGASRFLKGFLDLLTVWFTIRFGRRPMHLLGGTGVLVVVLGLGIAVASHWVSGLICIVLGLQFLAFGLVAEHRLASDRAKRESYGVAERIGFETESV